MTKFNPETGAPISDRTSYRDPETGERVTRADVARTQAQRDKQALDEIRCPFCDETRGHALVLAHGEKRECPGWALDDEAIRRGHENRAQVVAEFRAAVDSSELLHSDDADDCCACDLHACLTNHVHHGDEPREFCPLCVE